MSSGAKQKEGNEKLQSKEGLTEVIGFLKFSLALATGSLVFSAGIVKETINLSIETKCLLVASWVILGGSVVSGVLAYMRIPILIAKKDYNLRDSYLETPGRIHQILFGLGTFLLGIALSFALFSK